MTVAGEGTASNIQDAKTLKSLPDPPTDIVSDPGSRNESCLRLYWSSTDPDVYEYNVGTIDFTVTKYSLENIKHSFLLFIPFSCHFIDLKRTIISNSIPE